jgi:hypothetical protein
MILHRSQGQTMASITQDLASQLAGAPVQQIAQQLGVSPSQAQGAIATALPLLMGALGNNASQPQGAQALHAALQDHAGGDIAGVLGAVLGGAMGGAGGGSGDTLGRMLGHIFGGQQQQATQGLGQATGLGGDKTQMLLRILAPIVMAYLANHMFGGQQQQAVAQDSSPQGLGDILGREVEQIGGQQGGGLGGLLGQVLGGGNAGGLGGLLGGILGGRS